MKKTVLFFMALCLGVALNGFAQTTEKPAADFYVGKWELLIIGTPNGDATLNANLVRTDGKLTGTITPKAEGSKEEIKIASIEEADGKITLYFNIQGYDVNLGLEKVDDENVKGSLMGMFDAKGKRIKE